jgi:hypothetical protein
MAIVRIELKESTAKELARIVEDCSLMEMNGKTKAHLADVLMRLSRSLGPKGGE